MALLSPAKLCTRRIIWSSVPHIKNLLAHTWIYIPEFSKKNSDFKEKQKRDYDYRHRVHDLPDIPDDTQGWIQSETEALQGRISTHLTHQDHMLLKHQLEICRGIITISALFLPHMKWKIIRSVNQGKQVNRPAIQRLEES